jgi:hypothetical protein
LRISLSAATPGLNRGPFLHPFLRICIAAGHLPPAVGCCTLRFGGRFRGRMFVKTHFPILRCSVYPAAFIDFSPPPKVFFGDFLRKRARSMIRSLQNPKRGELPSIGLEMRV